MNEASTAISSDSTRPVQERIGLRDARREHARDEARAVVEPVTKRSAEVEARERVDDVAASAIHAARARTSAPAHPSHDSPP
jgi:thiamine pyrophosphate-dependent acetolactate synthase large subunit-like protein